MHCRTSFKGVVRAVPPFSVVEAVKAKWAMARYERAMSCHKVTSAVIEAVERLRSFRKKSREAAEVARSDRAAHLRLEQFFQAV